MEATKLTTSVAAILTALLIPSIIMHHPSLTAADTIAQHTTSPAKANASLGAAGFSLQLVAPDHDDLDHTVRRGSDGFLHLQSLRTGLRPPSGGAANSSSATALRPADSSTYAPLRLPTSLVVTVGNGPGKQDYLFKVDAAGRMIWMQCKGCDPHSPQRHPLFDTSTSVTYHLVAGTDPFCQPPYWSEFGGQACAFRVDGPPGGLSVEGYLGSDQLTYNRVVHRNVPFGCAHRAHNFRNDGLFAGVIGAAAVARGLTRFSYCLFHAGDASNRRGFLRFGTDVPRNPRYRTTQILPHDESSSSSGGHHYVSLVGISLGARRLHGIRPEMFARAQGGCVIDLSTPVTVMARAAYDVVEEALWSDLQRHGAERVARRDQYGLCVRAWDHAIKGRLQSLSLHFSPARSASEDEAVLVVSPEQLFLMMDDEQGRSIACLAVTPGRRTIIGALQQVDTRFVFDLKDSTLSFEPESCIRDTVQVV